MRKIFIREREGERGEERGTGGGETETIMSAEDNASSTTFRELVLSKQSEN